MNFSRLIRLGIVSVILFVGCQKGRSDLSGSGKPPGGDSGDNQQPILNPRLEYEDSLFYLKTQTGNYSVVPVSKPNATGYFHAIPKGLVIDSTTGSINISQSETGLRYKIYYVAADGTVLDSTKLVISGVDYRDAIVEIASTPNRYDTVFPIYNARPELKLPCADEDDDDDGGLDDDDNDCVFDETDLNGDGDDDIDGVIQDKLLVDIKKGTIDIEASFHAGIFGSSNPRDGLMRDFTFYYRLGDASNRALNKITVRVYHYRNRSNIPQALLDTLTYRTEIHTAVNSRNGSADAVMNNGLFRFSRIMAMKPKRPPIIIIVSR
jgi:hypothetical protein